MPASFGNKKPKTVSLPAEPQQQQKTSENQIQLAVAQFLNFLNDRHPTDRPIR